MVKFNFGQLKDHLHCKGILNDRTELILPMDFRVNLLGSPNECKEFAIQVTLQSCWTNGNTPQSCEDGETTGNQPWMYLCSPRTACIHWDCPSTATSSWCRRWRTWQWLVQLTEQIYWFQEKQNSPGISLEERRNCVIMALLSTVLFPLVG